MCSRVARILHECKIFPETHSQSKGDSLCQTTPWSGLEGLAPAAPARQGSPSPCARTLARAAVPGGEAAQSPPSQPLARFLPWRSHVVTERCISSISSREGRVVHPSGDSLTPASCAQACRGSFACWASQRGPPWAGSVPARLPSAPSPRALVPASPEHTCSSRLERSMARSAAACDWVSHRAQESPAL